MNNKWKRLSIAFQKSLVVSFAIDAIWYALEWKQFRELQTYQWGDNVVGIIYLFLIAWFYYKQDEN